MASTPIAMEIDSPAYGQPTVGKANGIPAQPAPTAKLTDMIPLYRPTKVSV
jgi:hypothetical protein